LFAAIGLDWLCKFALSFSNKSDLDCINEGIFEFISAHEVSGVRYELVAATSGFQDKVTFLILYPTESRIGTCIPSKEVADMTSIGFGPEHGPIQQFPSKINVRSKKIKISYASPPKPMLPLVNVPVVWSND